MKSVRWLAFITLFAFVLLLILQHGIIGSSADVQIFRAIGDEILQFLNTKTLTFGQGYYPPFTSILFFFLVANPWHLSFTAAWIALLSLLAFGMVLRALRGEHDMAPIVLLWSVIVSSALLGPHVVFARFDIFVLFALFWAWNAWSKKSYGWSGFALSLAASLKIVPLLLFPILLVITPRSQWRKTIVGFGGGVVGTSLLALLVLGRAGFMENIRVMVTFHTARGVHIESLWSSVQMFIAQLSGNAAHVANHHFAIHNADLGQGTIHLATFLILLGIGAIACIAYRFPRNSAIPRDLFLFAAGFWILAISPILSPQYLVWFAPLLLTWATMRILYSSATVFHWIVVGVVCCMEFLTQIVWPLHYGELIEQKTLFFTILLIARNGMLLLLPFFLLTEVYQKQIVAWKTFVLSPTHRTFIQHILLWGIGGVSLVYALFITTLPLNESGLSRAFVMGTATFGVCWFLALYCLGKAAAHKKILAATFLFGVWLRAVYLATTDYIARSHDVGGHIEYIQYVAKHFSIPLASSGWELHQAPFYYFLGAIQYRIGQSFGFAEVALLRQLQYTSFVFSILSLAAVLWIAVQLFPRKEQTWLAAAFTLVVSTVPGIMFATARISNDALFQTLAFVAVGLLLSFWKKPRFRTWYVLIATIILGLLTKGNMTLLGITSFLVLLAHPVVRFQKKLMHGFLASVLIVLLVGWLPILRAREPNARMVPFGAFGFNDGLMIPSEPWQFLSFNPIQTIAIPYANPWDDAARRQFFWEYFLKSAIVGEFGTASAHHMVFSFILTALLVSLFCGFVGIVSRFRLSLFREMLPLLILFVVTMAGHIYFRVKIPCACTQDFRFSPHVFIPLAYVMVSGLKMLRGRMQSIAVGTVCVFLLLCVWYLIQITVFSYA